ncbi:hypothetical protein BSZ35_08070 [Salinibacter sp. 10B]|uniref:hypothetical protein n=1 Tax=Salinibacter sp. 10B TaxID=1923971 RepID=UPI000CF44B37|nr:hypothetical protein [Salinibacter sp. 10B]PQJ34557.1 hypothetical protein BSZ35_08070 [Salinibacter sp. 10B]
MKLTSKYPTSQKQLDIVLNLNQLTKKERIEWEPADRERAENQVRSVPVYESVWKDHHVRILHGDPPLEKSDVRIDEEPNSYWIQIIGTDDGEIVIPPMPAVEDLVDTIERKAGLNPQEVNDPETLNNFNRLLEEEL